VSDEITPEAARAELRRRAQEELARRRAASVRPPEGRFTVLNPVTPPQGDDRGFVQRAVDSAKEGIHAVGTVAKDIYDTGGAALADPAKLSAAARGIDDVLTAGYGQKFADWASSKRPLGFGGIAPTSTEERAAVPEYRTTGNIGGSFLPNAAGAVGGSAARRILGPLVNRAKGKLAGAGAGVVQSVAGYEASAVPLAAAQATAQGDDVLPAVQRAATDPLGLILSARHGATAGGARGFANRVRDPSTQSGRDLRDIEAVGGRTTMIGEPAKGGGFESPQLSGTPEGKAGSHEVGRRAVADIEGHNTSKLAAAREQYGYEMDGILGENARKRFVPEKAHAVLDDMINRNTTSNGKVIDPSIGKFVEDARGLLSTTYGFKRAPDLPIHDIAGQTATTKAGVRSEVPAVLVEDMIKVKQAITDKAQWGTPATPDNAPFRVLAKALAEDAAQVDPRIADLNKRYGKTMEGLKEANDILFGSRKADLSDSAGRDRRGEMKFVRAGGDSDAALGEAPQLDRLAALDPKYAEWVVLAKAKNAAERLRYGTSVPGSTNIGNAFAVPARQAAARGAGAVVGGALGGIGGAVAGQAVGGLAGNLPQARVRIGLPIAERVAKGGPGFKGGLAADQLINAIRRRKRNAVQEAQE
jgi:hypothetical protein